MNDWKGKMIEEIDVLRQLRDELRLKAHLGRAEARERWEKLEHSWHHLEGKLKLLHEESSESAEEIREAARLLADEIRDGYQHFKNLV